MDWEEVKRTAIERATSAKGALIDLTDQIDINQSKQILNDVATRTVTTAEDLIQSEAARKVKDFGIRTALSP